MTHHVAGRFAGGRIVALSLLALVGCSYPTAAPDAAAADGSAAPPYGAPCETPGVSEGELRCDGSFQPADGVGLWIAYARGEAFEGRSVDVTDFGADPSGKKDATPALQAAVDDLCAKGGGTVRIPAGTFLIRAARGEHYGVIVACDELSIRGAGPTATRLVGDPANKTGGRNQATMFRFFETKNSSLRDLSADGNWDPERDGPRLGWSQLVRFLGVDGAHAEDLFCTSMSNHCVSVRVSDAECAVDGGGCEGGRRCCDSGFNASNACSATADCVKPSRDGRVVRVGCVGCNGSAAIVWSNKGIGVKNERIAFEDIYGHDAVKYHGFECRYSDDCSLRGGSFTGNAGVGVNVEEACDRFEVTHVHAIGNDKAGMKTQGFPSGSCVRGGGTCAPPAMCCDAGWRENESCTTQEQCRGGRPRGLTVRNSHLSRNGAYGFFNIRGDDVALIDVELAGNARSGYADQPNRGGNPLNTNSGTRIVDCSVRDNGEAGVLLRDITDATVEGGSITGNPRGIQLVTPGIELRIEGAGVRGNAEADVFRLKAAAGRSAAGRKAHTTFITVPETGDRGDWVGASALTLAGETNRTAEWSFDEGSLSDDRLALWQTTAGSATYGIELATFSGDRSRLTLKARVKLAHDENGDGVKLVWRVAGKDDSVAEVRGAGRWHWVTRSVDGEALRATVGLKPATPGDRVLIDGYLVVRDD